MGAGEVEDGWGVISHVLGGEVWRGRLYSLVKCEFPLQVFILANSPILAHAFLFS